MKMLKRNLNVFGFAVILFSASGCIASANNHWGANIKMRVIDDTGQPVEGVHSKIFTASFYNAPPDLTDTNGMVSIYLQSINIEIGGSFTKAGHYESSGIFWKYRNVEPIPPADTNFTIVLKRIIEPLPLIKKEVNVAFPRFGEPIGFDMEMGDWIFPDGKGKKTDVLFTANGHYVSDKDFAITALAEFLGDKNGVQSFNVPPEGAGALLRSELPPPSVAPESGYEKRLERFLRHIPPERWASSSYDKNRRWIFRVRTEVDENMDIIATNYGWFATDISIGPFGETAKILLRYYYNPDPHSRSLEPKEIADRQGK